MLKITQLDITACPQFNISTTRFSILNMSTLIFVYLSVCCFVYIKNNSIVYMLNCLDVFFYTLHYIGNVNN